ncbi:hypothetical protein BCR42DRAFT_404054, partial [Absidia repens]
MVSTGTVQYAWYILILYTPPSLTICIILFYVFFFSLFLQFCESDWLSLIVVIKKNVFKGALLS